MSDRPTTEPRTHRNAAGKEFMTVACDRCGFTHAHPIEAEAAQGAAPRGYVDGMYHLTGPEYNAALRRAYKDGRAAPRAEGPQAAPLDVSAMADTLRYLDHADEPCDAPNKHRHEHVAMGIIGQYPRIAALHARRARLTPEPGDGEPQR